MEEEEVGTELAESSRKVWAEKSIRFDFCKIVSDLLNFS